MAQKFKVKDDVSFSIGTAPERVVKAGVHEVAEKDREAFEYLERAGLAERVKTSSKEG